MDLESIEADLKKDWPKLVSFMAAFTMSVSNMRRSKTR